MSETGHDLHALFPGEGPLLHALKLEDSHFREVAARHHALATEVQRVESGLAPTSDERIDELKNQRLQLLDEVVEMIASRKAE